MKFRRLTDNLPAYKSGEIYEVVDPDSLDHYSSPYYDLNQDDCGYVIKNRIGSQYYFSRRTYLDKIEFDRKWKREE